MYLLMNTFREKSRYICLAVADSLINTRTFFQNHSPGSFERTEKAAARGIAGLGHSVLDVTRSTGTFELSLGCRSLVYETLEPVFGRHWYAVTVVNSTHEEPIRTLFPTGNALDFFD